MTTKSLSLLTATLLFTTFAHADTTLDEITVVSTNKSPTLITKTTTNITVIRAEKIKEHGYQNVAQALSSVSGISIANTGGLGQPSSLFLRGASGGKVLVLLDGMRLNDPSNTEGQAQLESLTTQNIERIEVIKGATGSIWGSNASAGVINIITKSATDGIHGSLGLTYGSYDTKGTNAQLSYKGEKLSAQILASYLDTDSFSALAPSEAESDAYTNKNINLKLGYTVNPNNTLNLSYNNIHTDTQYDDTYSIAGSKDDYSHATSEQTNVALDYLYTKDNYTATIHTSKGNYNRDYYTTGLFEDGHNIYKAILKEYALIHAYKYTHGKAILGFEYKDIDGLQQFNNFAKSQSEYTNKALYISNIYDITKNTFLETNLRFDNYSKFDNKTTYKAGVKHTYEFLEGLTSSANYYTSYDAPSAYQLANSISTALLKPSYTRGYDISLNYKDIFSLTYFNTKVEDTIDYVGVFPVSGYTNIKGTSKFSGLEVESSYTFTAINLIFSANYTHLFHYEKEDGSDLLRRAKDTLNTSLNYYTSNDMQFGMDILYVGDNIDTDGGFPISSHINIGNYTVWNLNFNTKIMNDYDISIHAKNIFDKEYQSVYSYATQGRSIYAKISYNF